MQYEVVFENAKQRFEVKSDENALEIKTPVFAKGGNYVVELSEIMDGNGCSWPVESNIVSIHVLPQRSSARVSSDRIGLLIGEKADVPLNLVGRY
jgi:hypothetical protein